ncbi:MAG TPA: hypothetical protein VKD04_01860 [Burkholderiales bacterium]|nr:hypothetical protein [Burkholderiales bacterium]
MMRRTSRHFTRLRSLAAILVLLASATAAFACGEVFRGDMVTAEREVGATRSGEAATFHVLGAGWFHAAEIVKRGGSSDDTSVTLELDGESIIIASFADLKNPWREINTPMIIVNVRTVGDTSTMTIWYAPELKFRAMAALRVEVQEEGVESLKMRTVMNKPAPHEHIAGQQIGTTAALPAFK